MATALPSHIKHYVRKANMIAEQLCTETTILHQEYAEIKAVMDIRKERNSGKCKILKDDRVVARPDVVEALEEAERITSKEGKETTKPFTT